MRKLKIIFAGTPDFAASILKKIIDSNHEVCLVLTQPDRPSGRGMKLKSPPVKLLAVEHNIPVLQSESLKDEITQRLLSETNSDMMVVAAYGLIIPKQVLDMPKFGCYNVHASLLPRWRGAAPIQRSILAGDAETGVTIMKVVPALDAGDMVMKSAIPIGSDDTAQTLHDKLALIGADLMLAVINVLAERGNIESIPQDESKVTYAEKLQKSEALLDWTKSAVELSRQVRAFNPFPVATTVIEGEICRIWMASAKDGKGLPGVLHNVDDMLLVGCGEGLLLLQEIQMPGGRRLKASEFLAGRPLKLGQKIG